MSTGPRKWWIAPVHLAVYLTASAAWMLGLGVLLAVGLLLAPQFGVPVPPDMFTDPAALASAPGFGAALAGFTVIQLLGLAVVAVGLAAAIPRDDAPGLLARIPLNLGLARPRWGALPLAFAIGLCAGMFPSWVSDQVHDQLPNLGSMAYDLISGAMSGDLLTRGLMILGVCVAAPTCEELVFRGYLWSACERSAPPVVAWIATSVLFTAYHMDPSQMIGVLPIAFALGWVRWQTGSLWPGVVVHAVNNGLAMVATLTLEENARTPIWLALPGLFATLALCAAVWWVGPRRPAAAPSEAAA